MRLIDSYFYPIDIKYSSGNYDYYQVIRTTKSNYYRNGIRTHKANCELLKTRWPLYIATAVRKHFKDIDYSIINPQIVDFISRAIGIYERNNRYPLNDFLIKHYCEKHNLKESFVDCSQMWEVYSKVYRTYTMSRDFLNVGSFVFIVDIEAHV
jgi:hypothetical protein